MKNVLIYLLIILATVNTVQSQESREEEEARRKAELYKKWGQAFELFSFRDKTPKVIDIGFSNIDLVRGASGGAIRLDFKEKLAKTSLIFSV